MPDMQGKTVVVTGANSGIGLETAAALAAMGAPVLVTARNADKGRAAVADITQRTDAKSPRSKTMSWTWATWRRCGGARRRSSSRLRGSTCSSTTRDSC